MCDRIAFDFCFEVSAEGEVRIFPWNDRANEIEVSYRIAGSTIQVAPWPVGVDSQEPNAGAAGSVRNEKSAVCHPLRISAIVP
jgi:hypothetical protein